MARDTIFSEPLTSVKPFAFDERVAAVFEDMISRSVPLYREVQRVTAELGARFMGPGERVYDLGCSTGVTLLNLTAVRNRPQSTASRPEKSSAVPSWEIIGVDSSPSMISECERILANAGVREEVRLETADLLTFVPEQARLMVMNYTLQFIEPGSRRSLLSRLYESLLPGGFLLLSEKVTHHLPEAQDALTSLHWEFKREQGYSALEIAQKRDAIENVLVPLTLEENVALLQSAGFSQTEILLKSYTFVTLLAKR